MLNELSHVTLASDGRLPLFPDEALRRAAVRRLAAVCRLALVLFSIVDDHLHLVLQAGAQRRGRLLKSLNDSLSSLAGIPLAASRPRPVKDVSHLESLVPYHLRQIVRRGLPAHPALWSGSCFQDMAGTRWIPGLRLRLHELLPRFRLRTAYEHVGLPPMPLSPADDQLVRMLGAPRLVAAASAAVAADPALRGRRPEVVAARRATIAIGIAAELPLGELAWSLGVSRCTARRLRDQNAVPESLLAVRMRLSLEQVVAAQASSVQLAELARESRR